MSQSTLNLSEFFFKTFYHLQKANEKVGNSDRSFARANQASKERFSCHVGPYEQERRCDQSGHTLNGNIHYYLHCQSLNYIFFCQEINVV
jgi:hypothetical protein